MKQIQKASEIHYFKEIVVCLLLSLLLLSCNNNCPAYYAYRAPKSYSDDLLTASISEMGMDSLYLNKLIDCIYANKFDQVHSILIAREGKLVFEKYLEGNKFKGDGQYYHGDRIKWHKDTLHTIMSCTKSVTSAIIGIAVDKGYFKVEDPIFRYLPDHQKHNKDEKGKITIEHLLTMTSGLDWDEWGAAHGTSANDIDRIYIECQKDPLECVLAKDLIHTPGEKFNYSGGNMILLGEVLRNAVGMDILEFGKQHLFNILKIDPVLWYQFENGVFACDGSLMLKPRDMLKFGMVFLNEGKWNERQIISKDWVDKSKTTYNNNQGINVPLDDAGKNDYGYTWWLNKISGNGIKANIFQASGWGGQEIIVIPELTMVVVFTGGNYTVKKRIHQMLEKYIIQSIM